MGRDQEQPSLRDRLRPLELLGISAGLGVFAGLVTLLVTRDWMLSGIVLGVGFVIALVVLAMLALGTKDPDDLPQGPVLDRDEDGPAPH